MAEHKAPPSTPMMVSIGLAVITAGVLGWVSQQSDTSTNLTSLEPKIERVISDVERLEEDIDRAVQAQLDWQQNGELPLDVQQNERISNLTSQNAELQDDIRDLEARIRRLEAG